MSDKEQENTKVSTESKDVMTEKTESKPSPFLSKNDTSKTEDAGSKKACPFLTKTELKEEKDENVEVEDKTAKKQHEIIDNLCKDNAIFNGIGKLYFLSSKTGKPETRGEGKFLILKDDSGLHRLTMIRDQVMLKGCNHYIMPSCPLIKATKAKNGWTWTALGDKSDAEKNEDSIVYFAIFKDEETSNLFESSYNKAKDLNQEFFKNKKKDN
jgi:hypothetical protein